MIKNNMLAFWQETEEYGYLSNFYPAPIKLTYYDDDLYFSCSEQVFMYIKAMYFEDVETADKILNFKGHPIGYKKLGRQVQGFSDKKWELFRIKTMLFANWNKFNQNPELKEELIETGDLVLVEASPFDKIWGIGLATHDEEGLPLKEWSNRYKWKGDNHLGRVLMHLRRQFQYEEGVIKWH